MAKILLPEYFFVKVTCLLFISLFHTGSLFSEEYAREHNSLPSSVSSFESERESKNNITKFYGEFFKYNIGFWLFKKMGTATLQCKKEHNYMTVTIDAVTTGMIGKMLHRHNTYRTTMVFDNDTNSLKPLDTYEKKIKGGRERIKITNYDYVNDVRKFKIWKNGTIRRENEIKLENRVKDDGISAFYNLRNEMYGEVKEGASFDIGTAYRDRSTDSKVYVRLPAKSDKLSKWDQGALNVRFVADITMDPEIFDSEEGKLVILFTEDLKPVGFIAKNVIGFGDLYGILERNTN